MAPPEAERAGVAHEDGRRERVEPQEPDAGPDQAGADQRQVLLATGQEGDRRVGEEDDRRAPPRQAVKAVGQVHAVGRSGQHEEDQHRVEHPEVDGEVEDPRVERLVEADIARGHPPQAEGDHRLGDDLPPPRQPERALLGDLRPVVEEAEEGAGQGGAEHGEARRVVLAEDQERHGDREEDHQPAHGRSARLPRVALGPLLADVLAELALAQERDELRSQEHADEQRGHPRDQDLSEHGRLAGPSRRGQARAREGGCVRRPPGDVHAQRASPSTRSRPAERDPLTSTRSPGRARRSSSAPASSGVSTLWRSPSPKASR